MCNIEDMTQVEPGNLYNLVMDDGTEHFIGIDKNDGLKIAGHTQDGRQVSVNAAEVVHAVPFGEDR